MITPEIRFYARLEYCKDSKKTPKYKIVARAGYYEPMESLKSKKGEITFYLMEKLKEGANVPSVRLQGKNSLNFTGLKEYFQDGKLSGFAYGYPLSEPTYSKDKKPNPFYKYRKDAFLFIVHQKEQEPTPDYFEMVVLADAKCLASAYCKQLQMGGFDDALADLRKQAMPPI